MRDSTRKTKWECVLAGAIAFVTAHACAGDRPAFRTRLEPQQLFRQSEFEDDASLVDRPVYLTGIETESEPEFEEFATVATAIEDAEDEPVGRARVNRGRSNRLTQYEEELPIARIAPDPDQAPDRDPDLEPPMIPEPATNPTPKSSGIKTWQGSSSCQPCCDLTNDPCLSSCFGQKLLMPRLGAVFLHRSAPRNDVLVLNPFDPSQNINAKDFNPGWGAGVDAGVTMLNGFSSGNDLEIRYWGINDWSDQQFLHATGLVTQINSNPPTLVTGAQDVTAKWSSQLQSFETNWRQRNPDQPYSILAGFRYLELDDRVDAVFVDPTGVLANSALHVHTRNRLYGLQTGMDYSVFSDCRTCVRVYSKSGIFGNATANSADYRCNCIPPVTHRANDSSDRLSFLSEVGIAGRYSCGRNWFLSSQYQAMWLTGVSTATDQLSHTNFNTGSGMLNSGQVFFHGGTIGLERAF